MAEKAILSRGRTALSRFEVDRGTGVGAALLVYLEKGSKIRAESDALVSKSKHVEVGSELDGGLWEALWRATVARESFFLQTIKGKRDGQDALLAPRSPGDIVLLDISPQKAFCVISGAFLASQSGVHVKTVTQLSWRKAFWGNGLFVLNATGSGMLAINCTGSMVHYVLAKGERRAVDNGHVVAWSATMDYETRMASSTILGSLTSGEGMMCFFQGPGELYVQTHREQTVLDLSQGKTRSQVNVCLIMAVIAVTVVALLAILLISVAVVDYLTSKSLQQHDSYRFSTPDEL
mmetsp:Transcript_19116/g.35376  ORF Transcript_19116/g.35376 Transcript_19116/m.35376 type:complete len:292 (-) Transcript_19116:275-1150(-)